MSLRVARAGIFSQKSPLVRQFSTSQNIDENHEKKFFPVYVHHLSRIILEHLQGPRRDFILQHRLQSNLKLNPDGTFVIRFPAHNNQKDNGRIWTSYDGGKKQHWLSVYKEGLVGRFLLKDNLNGPVFLPEKELKQRLQNSVDLMIERLGGVDIEKTSP